MDAAQAGFSAADSPVGSVSAGGQIGDHLAILDSQTLRDPPRWSRWMPEGRDAEGSLRWSSLFLKDRTLWKGPMLELVVRTHAGEVHGGQCPVGGTPRRSRARVRSPLPVEEGAVETCDELSATPIPCPPALEGEEGEKTGSRAELWKQGEVGEGLFEFYSSLSYSHD